MRSIKVQAGRAALRYAISTDTQLVGPGRAPGDTTGAELAAPGESDYRAGLPTSALVAEIRGLLATERRVERLICRYLADLADRIQARQEAELGSYDDEFHAARCCFGLGARDTRERVRVGRALRTLPGIERAFIDGELCYSRVRELTRVATMSSERDWLELAGRLNMRSLERRVAAERGASRQESGRRDEASRQESGRRDERRAELPARTEWIGSGRVRVTFELSTEAWTLLERAMREARRAGAAGPGDGDALEAVVRAALSLRRADTSNAGEGDGLGAAPTQGESTARLGAAPTQGESTARLGAAPTQSGSWGEPTDQRIDHERVGIGSVEQACEPASRLMEVMGRSRGWTLDALTESSGLSAREVSVALTLLELGGHVRRRAFAFEPV